MSTDFTLLSSEMDAVRTQGTGAHYLIKVQLLVNKQWITPLRVDSESVERDYEQGFADVRVLSLMLMQGQYTYDIQPYRNELQLDLTYVPLSESTADQSGNQRSITKRYRAYLMDTDNAALTSQVSNQVSKEALDRLPPITVELQLIEEYVFDLQMRSVGGIYRQETPYNVLMSILTSTLGYLEGSDEKRILGVNQRGKPNTTKRTQIPLSPTRIGQVASRLQNEEGGVFSAGLGCYLQDQYWYVFPLYDTTHASKQKRSITVYSVPSDRYEGSERTYRLTDNRIVLLASGDAGTYNNTENQQIQAGNGLRFLDVKKVLGDFGVTQNNRLLIDRASNLFEVVSKEVQKGVNNVQWSGTGATSNPYAQYTALARLEGRVVVVDWNHGDADLLEPGALLEYHAVSGDVINTYRGVLLGTHEVSISPEPGVVTIRHSTKVRLKLFITNQTTEAGGG